MRFSINNRVYLVFISARAKTNLHYQIIRLSTELPHGGRRESLFRELRRAWLHEFPLEVDREREAEQCAAMMESLFAQFFAQGGDTALSRLMPIADKPPPSSARLAALASFRIRKVQCGYCRGSIGMDAISNIAPEWNTFESVYVIRRHADCDFCGHRTSWSEIADGEGKPSGALVPWPPVSVRRLATGRAEFLLRKLRN